jgi:hypothetical protein
MRTLLVVTAVLLVSPAADAGGLSGLARLARTGKATSAAAKLSRGAKLGRLAAGVSSALVAERAAASLGGLAVVGAGYLARSSRGELLLAKATGTPQIIDDAAHVATALGPKATVVIDPSVASTPGVLGSLPADAELLLADGPRRLQLRRVEKNGVVDFVVEHGADAFDLADYAASLVPDDDERAPGDEPLALGPVAVGALVIAAALLVRRLRRPA